MTSLCFIDTETTSLRADRRAWEIGIVARREAGHEVEHHWFIDASYLDLGNADPFALKVGRFHERHPQYQLDWEPDHTATETEYDVLRLVEAITRGAHLVGAVVSFDAEVLGNRMRANGICPSWHYHLIDCEALAIGYLAGSPAYGQSSSGVKQQLTRDTIGPPWKSDDLSAALGVKVSDEERHTALGDAKWAMRIYDAVTGRLP